MWRISTGNGWLADCFELFGGHKLHRNLRTNDLSVSLRARQTVFCGIIAVYGSRVHL